MSAHKPNKHMAYREFHHHHKTVFVSPDIEHITLIPNIVRCRKINLDVRKVLVISYQRSKAVFASACPSDS